MANPVDKELEKTLTDFCSGHINSRNTYVMIIKNKDGEIELHNRVARPCYGEMRNYKEKSLNRPLDRFPSDLINNFPDGTPVGVALPRNSVPADVAPYLWGPYNPWLGKNETFTDNVVFLKNDAGEIVGTWINTGDIPPTYLVATMMSQRRAWNSFHNNMKILTDLGVSEKNSVLINFLYQYLINPSAPFSLIWTGIIGQNTRFDLFFDQAPLDLDGGMVWSERCDYNRPGIMNAFSIPIPDQKDMYGNQVYENPGHFISYGTIENFIKRFNL